MSVASLAAGVAAGLAACSGNIDVPAARPVAPCPTVLPATSAVASVPVHPPPLHPAPVPTVLPAKPPPDAGVARLLWADTFADGDPLIFALGAGLAVVPRNVGGTVAGATIGVLDAAGLPLWETSFGAYGAISAAVLPSGGIAAVNVDALDWPKTEEAFEQRRVTLYERDKKPRSWQMPAGASLDHIEVDPNNHVVLSGRIRGTVKLTPALTVRAEADEERSFVAGTDLAGKVAWARDFGDATLDVHVTSTGKTAVLQLHPNTLVPPRRISLFDAAGRQLWQVDAPGDCVPRSLLTTPTEGIHVIADGPCFGAEPAPRRPSTSDPNGPTEAFGCELATLDPATGQTKRTMFVPDCKVAGDESGFVTVDDNFGLSVLDTNGKVQWSATAQRARCLYFAWADVVVTADSVFLAGICAGERVGTMMNSPYSYASARSDTYLVRYARK